MSSWREQMMDLGRKQTELFERDHMAYTDALCIGDSVRNLMSNVYLSLVGGNKVLSVERWDRIKKEELWEQTKDIANGRLSQPKLIELSYALIAIEYFLNEK